jgi:type II secretory pathway component PulC
MGAAAGYGRKLSLAWIGLALCGVVSADASAPDRSDVAAVRQVAARWVKAVSARDPACFDLLSRSGRAYYPRMRQLALRADAGELLSLHPVDQLQVLFLRGMLSPTELEAMSERELLVFALEQGFIGADLRAQDALREVVTDSGEARGRLYKFGRDERPDRGLQYFVREDRGWRVDLRGERERMQSDFDAFVARSGLSEPEAAFFILEMRLMRKVTPADFAPADSPGIAPQPRPAPPEAAMPALRLVAVRRPLDSDLPLAATIEDRAESLRYVLEPGDALPSIPGIRLARVHPDGAVFETNEGRITLPLDIGGPPLNQRLRLSRRAAAPSSRSLLAIASQGSDRAGLMAQWRNVGLRDRPLLLQQAWLTPVHAAQDGPSGHMRGVRVDQLTEGSFWDQLGAEPGDVLTAVNGRAIDSMDAWQGLVEVAMNDLAITLTLERDAKRLRFETRTIRPR